MFIDEVKHALGHLFTAHRLCSLLPFLITLLAIVLAVYVLHLLRIRILMSKKWQRWQDRRAKQKASDDRLMKQIPPLTAAAAPAGGHCVESPVRLTIASVPLVNGDRRTAG